MEELKESINDIQFQLMLDTDTPTDKSSHFYSCYLDKDLVCTKPLFVVIDCGDEEVTFTKANYVHELEVWFNNDDFCPIDKDSVVGWIAIDELMTSYKWSKQEP